jgi:hypothetical protein
MVHIDIMMIFNTDDAKRRNNTDSYDAGLIDDEDDAFL